MKLWYAVSGRGQGNVYISRPERDEHFKIWKGRLEGCICSAVCLMDADGEAELPRLTWDDEPVELELSLKKV